MKNSNINNLLFPGTLPVIWSYNHFLFLEKMLIYETISQKELVKKTGLNKTTLSEVKSDIIKMGWCKEIDFGSGKEITLKLCRVNEIKCFLGYWKFLKHTFFVRPHNIKARCLFNIPPDNFEKLFNKLSLNPDCRLIISGLNNNKEYTLITPYGKIIFLLESKLIQFLVDGFVLPVREKDIELLEDYIAEGIQNRILAMHSLIKEHFQNSRIKIMDIIYLNSLHVGIVTKKNLSKAIHLEERIKNLKMFTDGSIYNCDEIETEGELALVLNRVKVMLNILFEKDIPQEDNQEFFQNANEMPLD